MPDYQKGKIYKLWSPQGDEIYIGSTINPLSKRLGQHKNKRDCNSKYLFENYNDVKIELIEEFPCDNKIQLNKKEGEHIRNNTCLNKDIPCRTKKEYRQDNKEYIKEQKKEYYQNNKEYYKEQKKEYYENNKEHILEKRKEYCEDNKERIIEGKKVWYENNKEKISENNKKKFNCNCGSVIRIHDKSKHLKTKKHIAFTQQQKD